MNKLLLLMCTILIISNLAFGQIALAPEEGDGSADNPYKISCVENLYWIACEDVTDPTLINRLSAKYIQTADIDFNEAEPDIDTWNDDTGWMPIGSLENKFIGTYNGNGHTISNLFIDRGTISYQGLFGYVSDSTATIQNLGVINQNINGCDEVGGIVGNLGNSATLHNCFSTGSVTGSRWIGGLVGYAEATTITACYSTATVIGIRYVGGFVGENGATISDCYSKGNVSRASGSYVSLGGFVGFNWGPTTKCYSIGWIKDSGTGANIGGGFCGEYKEGDMSGNFWDHQTSGTTTTAGTATYKTTSEMQTQSTFTNAGWDFDDAWAITSSVNDGYPYLQWALEADQSLSVELTVFKVEYQNGKVYLKWSTESETENLGFIVERQLRVASSEFRVAEWEEIASYVSNNSLAGHGSTSEAHDYAYTDAAVVPGATYLYRLGDVDYGGAVTWHKEVEVRVEVQDEQMPVVFGLMPAYPNPFNPSVTIPYGLTEDGNFALKVYNLRGELVKVLISTYALKGTYSYNWSPQNLSAGMYIIRMQAGNQSSMQKVVFVK